MKRRWCLGVGLGVVLILSVSGCGKDPSTTIDVPPATETSVGALGTVEQGHAYNVYKGVDREPQEPRQ